MQLVDFSLQQSTPGRSRSLLSFDLSENQTAQYINKYSSVLVKDTKPKLLQS